MPNCVSLASTLGLATFLAIVTGRVQGQDVDKQAILETWRREIRPVEEAYANCQINAWDFVRLKPEDEKLSFHRSFQFYRRGDLQRLDQRRFQARDKDMVSHIVGKVDAFSVFRGAEGEACKLSKRFAGYENDDGYANPRLLIPANFPPANGAFAIWGNQIVDFLSAPSVEFLDDEHPNPKRLKLRRFTCRAHVKADRPAQEGWFTVDESRHWVLVEHCWGVPGKRAIRRMFYDDQSDIPQVLRTEAWSEKDGKPVELIQEYRVKELRFEPPDEKGFTLAAFDIPENAQEEADKSR